MKLYYSAGACSLAPHIALQESGLIFDLEAVNLKTKETQSGKNFLEINPKGAVPALQLDNGEILTEAAVILQYIADQKPEKKLIPKAGTPERYRCQEWLNFVASEMHKGFSPLWNPKTPDEYKAIIKENLAKRFDFLTTQLQKGPYLMGEQYTVADAYLFTILGWSRHLAIDLTKWPKLLGFIETVKSRPATLAALEREKLKK